MTYSQDELDFWNAHETIRSKGDASARKDEEWCRDTPLSATSPAKFEAYRPRIVSRQQIRLIA